MKKMPEYPDHPGMLELVENDEIARALVVSAAKKIDDDKLMHAVEEKANYLYEGHMVTFANKHGRLGALLLMGYLLGRFANQASDVKEITRESLIRAAGYMASALVEKEENG